MSTSIQQAGKFLQEQLRMIEPEINQTVYPEYWGYEGKYHSVKNGLNFGVSTIKTARLDYTGTAVNFGGKATDIPLANFGIDTDSYDTLMGVLGAEWHWTELEQQEAATNAGTLNAVNVVQEYSNAMDKGIREWVHLKTLFGNYNNTSAGFTGFFNNPYAQVKVITDNLYNYTPQQLYDFFLTESFDFQKTSLLTAEATDLLLPIDLKRALLRRFGDNTGDGNPLRMMLNLNGKNDEPAYNSVSAVNELKYTYLNQYGISVTSQDMFIMYDNSVQTLYKYMSDIYTTPAQLKDDGMTYRVTSIVKLSEMIVKQPFRIRYYLIPTI